MFVAIAILILFVFILVSFYLWFGGKFVGNGEAEAQVLFGSVEAEEGRSWPRNVKSDGDINLNWSYL